MLSRRWLFLERDYSFTYRWLIGVGSSSPFSIVWTAEALNTAFEFLADAASPEFHPLVRDAKDVAAGAVLITAVAAVIIGAIVFWPYIQKLLS